MTSATFEARPVHFVPAAARLPRAEALPALTTLCSTCHLKDLCLPCGMSAPTVERLDGLHFGRRRVKGGEALYRAGDGFQAIYAVRSGTFKSVLGATDGREQVTGFSMAGELMGLDGLAQGKHPSTSIALEDAEICAIPYDHLMEMSAGSSELQRAVGKLMSREIVREHSLMMLLGTMNAEERLAAFLLNVSQRMKARGWSPSEFHLRMSRAEIGSYLGLKLETVSRTFSLFVQQGLLEVDKRHIRILNLEALMRTFEARLQ